MLQDAKLKVLKVLTLWDDIGIEQAHYTKRREILKNHLMDLLDAMITEEQNAVEALRASVYESEVCYAYHYPNF